jgi:hypothetical protein
MDFIQNLRFSSLLERFNYWNQRENRVAFFNNFPLPEDHVPKLRLLPNTFIIAPLYDGYEEFLGTTMKYHELTTNKIFVLRPYTNNTEYKCYQELYQASVLLKTFRINEPIFREVVTIDSKQYEYFEFKAPTDKTGDNVSTTFLYGTPTIESIREYIAEAKELLSAAKAISLSNQTGFPETVCFSLNRFKDDIGYYYSECLDWNSSFEDCIEDQVEWLGRVLSAFKFLNIFTETQIAATVAYARETWTQA